MNKIIILFICLSYLIAGCFSSAGIISMDDKRFFKEGPIIVTKENRYFVRFRYADEGFGFFMMTWSKIKEDKLIFYMPCTTSSGHKVGRLQLEEITTPQKIKLIKDGSVFWEDPEKNLIPMKVEVMKDSIVLENTYRRTH